MTNEPADPPHRIMETGQMKPIFVIAGKKYIEDEDCEGDVYLYPYEIDEESVSETQ